MTTEPDNPVTTSVRNRRHRVLVVVAVLGSLTLVAVGSAVAVPVSLFRQVSSVDVDPTALPDRPPKSDNARNAVDILLLGTLEQRCISAMVFHIDADRAGASFVSVPGTTLCSPTESHSLPLENDGVTAIAREIEHAAGVRLDHIAVLDWHAIARLTDIAGGMDVHLVPTARDPTWPNEYATVHGTEVASFIKGDADEHTLSNRQQILLDTVLQAMLHQEMRRDPRQLYDFLDIVTADLALDPTWSWFELGRLAFSLRNLRSADILYRTSPDIEETAKSGESSDFWETVRQDRIDGG